MIGCDVMRQGGGGGGVVRLMDVLWGFVSEKCLQSGFFSRFRGFLYFIVNFEFEKNIKKFVGHFQESTVDKCQKQKGRG